MLRPMQATYRDKAETFYCQHWRQFPPVSALMDIGVEEQRAKKLINNNQYKQHKVWERICGLAQGMDPEVCLSCPHVRKLVSVGANKPPHLVSLDGQHSFPIVDAVDIASRGHSRVSYQTATQSSRSAKLAGQRRDETNRPRTRSDG